MDREIQKLQDKITELETQRNTLEGKISDLKRKIEKYNELLTSGNLQKKSEELKSYFRSEIQIQRFSNSLIEVRQQLEVENKKMKILYSPAINIRVNDNTFSINPNELYVNASDVFMTQIDELLDFADRKRDEVVIKTDTVDEETLLVNRIKTGCKTDCTPKERVLPKENYTFIDLKDEIDKINDKIEICESKISYIENILVNNVQYFFI